MTEKEKMLNGLLYDASDSELEKMRFDARIMTEEFNSISIKNSEKRTNILKKLFGKCGENIYIEPTFNCDYGSNIYVGENFFANYNCVFLDVAEIHIGKNCLVGPQVGIYTASHPIEEKARIEGLELGKPVTIGDNCWIGGHSVINPGVTLGNNVIVASGSVVVKSFGDNVIIGGNPAKIIKYNKANNENFFIYETSLGKIKITEEDGSITKVTTDIDNFNPEYEKETALIKNTYNQIKRYLNGELIDFDIPIKLKGTDFQKSVWNELLKIPYGKTVSYKDIAEKIGNSKSCQAVGNAVGKNPLLIIVPCHRVIGTNGDLYGFSAGIDKKIKLLKLENKNIKKKPCF